MIATILNLIFACAIYYIGLKSVKFLPFLSRLNLPVAFIGGIIVLPILKLLEFQQNKNILVSSDLRDMLLVLFFCSMGLGIRFKEAIKGGYPLILISVLSFLLVIIQNFLSVVIMILFDFHPAYGLLAGSASYVGGFGSSLAWGTYYAELGLTNSLEVGFTSSMFGLICGGLLAGPTASWILKKHQLANTNVDTKVSTYKETTSEISVPNFRLGEKHFSFLWTCVLLLISILLGDILLNALKSFNIHLPRFLSAMLMAILLSNLANCFYSNLDNRISNFISELSLNAFIILSLFTIKIQGLSELFLPLIIILVFQAIVAVLFASKVVFKLMGKDFEAAVLSGGVIGFGLSSIAVAMATVKTIANNHGPAPKAILLTSLAGAALIDLANNLFIGILTRFPLFYYP